MTTAIREKPILFSAPMVRSIIDGRKTQTRRVVKLPERAHPEYCPAEWEQTIRCQWMEGPHHTAFIDRLHPTGPFMVCRCPYGKIGDQLWVRESAKLRSVGPDLGELSIIYGADGEQMDSQIKDHVLQPDDKQPYSAVRWTPGIHMPRWASRITLEITDVRVERLLDIQAAGVVAEGFPFSSDLDQFKLLWNQLNARRGFGWDSNPWVWVLSFRRADK